MPSPCGTAASGDTAVSTSPYGAGVRPGCRCEVGARGWAPMVSLGDGEGMSWRPPTPVPEMWHTEPEWDTGGMGGESQHGELGV